jgi:hypothetical protein
MGSPPPTGSKKVVLKFRSVKSIVRAPANTGNDNTKRIAVTRIDHTKRGVNIGVIPGSRMFLMVVMKLIPPKILLTPARCRDKIVRSTDLLVWAATEDSGG